MGIVQVGSSSGAGTISEKERVITQIKSSWDGTWSLARYLTPLAATTAAAPNMPSATLLYHYGEEIKRESATAFSAETPEAIQDYYVRIRRVDAQSHAVVWVGIFAEEEFKIHGALTAPQGDQVVTAYGLEHLLDRQGIHGAHVTEAGATVEIGWTPAFNEERRMGGPCYGNRSLAVGADGVYVFQKNGTEWDHLEIVKYLIAYYTQDAISFRLSGQYSSLAGLKSVCHFEGQTLYQALNHLIPRERGFGWCLRTTGDGHVNIHVFSVFGETVQAGSQAFPGNTETETFALDDSIKIGDASIKLSTARRYEKIIVEGERVKSCCTVDMPSGTLSGWWTQAEEDAYKQPFSSRRKDAAINDAERQTDQYRRVYQLFRVPQTWNWTVGSAQRIVAPAVNNDGTLDTTTSQTIWTSDRPFQRFLPLLDTVGGAYLDPLVIVKAATHGALTEHGDAQLWRYFIIDKMDYGRYTPCAVRMCDDMPGFEVRPQINHFLALNRFTDDPQASDADPTMIEPAIDYWTMMATVFIETDDRLRVVRTISSNSAQENLRVLRLYVPDAELWYIVPNTVTGVNEGALIHYAGRPTPKGSTATQAQRQAAQQAIVRDDSPRLNAIAALAAAWYGPERAAVSLELKYLASHSPVGTYVTSVSSSWHQQQAGTVVTEKAYDFRNMTTRLCTSYWELDITGMIDVPGMSDLRSVAKTIHRQEHEIRELRQHVGSLPARPSSPDLAKANLWTKLPLNQDGRTGEQHYGPFTIRRHNHGFTQLLDGQSLSNVYPPMENEIVLEGQRGWLGYDGKGQRIFFFNKGCGFGVYGSYGYPWSNWTQKQVKENGDDTQTDEDEFRKGLAEAENEWQLFWGLTGDDEAGNRRWETPVSVTGVTAQVRIYPMGAAGVIDECTVALGYITEPWDPETLTWANRPDVVEPWKLEFTVDDLTWVKGYIGGYFLPCSITTCYGFRLRVVDWSGWGDIEGVQGYIDEIVKYG